MFTEEQQRALVQIARDAVHACVTGQPRSTPPMEERRNTPPMQEPRNTRSTRNVEAFPDASGAFVTLKRHGELRGCIGTLVCRGPLAEEVARVAVSAAREDPRFQPVSPAELGDLDVEVSVLGPLERIDPLDATAVEVGRHGLVVEQGHRRGLLLPQVATEWNWDRETFLAQTCRKAGLPLDAWRRGATVYRFEADVFGG